MSSTKVARVSLRAPLSESVWASLARLYVDEIAKIASVRLASIGGATDLRNDVWDDYVSLFTTPLDAPERTINLALGSAKYCQGLASIQYLANIWLTPPRERGVFYPGWDHVVPIDECGARRVTALITEILEGR